MSWAIFVYTVLPTGALLIAMLASGQALAMSVASKVLSTPIRVGSLQLSLAVFMTAICGSLAAISYAGLCRSEQRMAQIGDTAFGAVNLHLSEQQQRYYFAWGRNYYLTLLGLALWLMAWRLKCLVDSQQLQTARAVAKRPVSISARIVYTLLGALAFLAADVPLCRINYNVQLATFVSPRKARLLPSIGTCEGAYLGSAAGPCIDFCDEVKALSQERLATIQFARNWHILGRFAAQIFDDARGVEQGEQRIQDLFQKKTCAQVLKSVDKSNQSVNIMCIIFAGVSIIGAFVSLSNAYEGSWGYRQGVSNVAKSE